MSSDKVINQDDITSGSSRSCLFGQCLACSCCLCLTRVKTHFAVIQFYHMVRDVVVLVIVRYDKNHFPARFQLGKNLVIEETLEHGILICCPFIKQINGSIFQIGGQQRQPFTLPVG